MNLDEYLKNINGRKVAVWGNEERNKKVLEIIKRKISEEVLFILSENHKKNEGIKVLDKKDLNSDYYVIVTEDYSAGIEEYLNNNGFSEIKDYLYIIHKPVTIYNEEEYTDIYNNKIKAPKGTKFEFLGYNSNININTAIGGNVKIKCTGSSIFIGANSFVNKKFPNNCILAGSPARLLRKNIAWDREEIDSRNIDKSIFWNMTR